MFKRLAEFWLVQEPGTAPGACQTLRHANDNQPGLCPAPNGARRSPTPVLTCHWFEYDGRLECRWGPPDRRRRLDHSGVARNELGKASACAIVFSESVRPPARWLWFWSRRSSASPSSPQLPRSALMVGA